MASQLPQGNWDNEAPVGTGTGTTTTAAPQGEWSNEQAVQQLPGQNLTNPQLPQTVVPDPTSPRTWGIIGRSLLEANPADWPGAFHDIGANIASRVSDWFGADRNKPPMWGGPGQAAANALRLPEPANVGEAALSGAVGLPAGLAGETTLLGTLGRSGDLWGTALRQMPGLAVAGGASGGATYGMPPELQLGAGLLAGTFAGEAIPGMRSGANTERLAARDAAINRGIEIPTGAVGPPGARFVSSATGVPGSGAAPSGGKSFVQWADSGARDIGADASDGGRFTQKVFDAGTTKINGLYNQVKAGANDVPAMTGSPFDNDIIALDRDMTRNATTPMPRVQNLMYDLMDAASKNTTAPGHIPGRTAVEMLQGGSRLDNMIRNPANSEELNYATQLKKALESATTSVMDPRVQATWNNADYLYKNWKTYKDAVTDTSGTVTPQSLEAAAKAHTDQGFFPVGGGAPGENARIGNTFKLTPPGTSTSPLLPPMAGWEGTAHGVGAGTMGLAALESLRMAHEAGLLDPKTALYATALYGGMAGANRVMRGLSGGPNPPGATGYYGRLLLNPGLYAQPADTARQQQ